MLTIKAASVGYHDNWLFEALNLTIDKGQIAMIDAPSGAGKTSLLRWIAGLQTEAMNKQGEVWLNGERIDHLPAENRHIGFLFQSPLLFPHLTIAENLGFGIPPTYPRKERQNRISDALKRAGMAEMESRDPETLSGGQQARIALLRTILAEPKALLMDEPFSSLDSDMRLQILDIVKSEVMRLHLPVIMVSHDPRDRDFCNMPPIMLTPHQ